MKKAIQKILPDSLVRYLYSKIILRIMVLNGYIRDFTRYVIYSDSFLLKRDIEIKGNIIKHYHVIEKGLVMPETRLGFGKEVILKLTKECQTYITRFGLGDSQVSHALNVIEEYSEFHKKNKYVLNQEIREAIEKTISMGRTVTASKQHFTSRDGYFSYTNESFELFSASRSSVRNFSDKDIPSEDLISALDLSKNAPSACNRQSWRTYIFSDKDQIQEILKVQGGNRGFGHLSNKLIVITGELGVFGHSFERNQVFIDGGIYAMNLLYSLHYKKIAACILNCSNTIEKDKRLRKLCSINKSEVFIAMIACGIPPEHFRIASSPRYNIDDFCTSSDTQKKVRLHQDILE